MQFHRHKVAQPDTAWTHLHVVTPASILLVNSRNSPPVKRGLVQKSSLWPGFAALLFQLFFIQLQVTYMYICSNRLGKVGKVLTKIPCPLAPAR